MNTLGGVSTTQVLSDKKQPKEIFHLNQTVTPGIIMWAISFFNVQASTVHGSILAYIHPQQGQFKWQAEISRISKLLLSSMNYVPSTLSWF